MYLKHTLVLISACPRPKIECLSEYIVAIKSKVNNNIHGTSFLSNRALIGSPYFNF